jgi:hypothetical protein
MLGGPGLLDALVAPILFVLLYRTVGLDAAVLGAGGVAVGAVAVRRLRGQPTTAAWSGAGGVLIGAALAKGTGSSDGFFLPKVAGSAITAIACIVSVVIGRPLVGVLWAVLSSRPPAWGWRPEVRRTLSALTLLWASGSVLRAVAYGTLIADDEDRAGSLAAASAILGLPLTGLMLGITILVIRRLPRGPEPDPEPARA